MSHYQHCMPHCMRSLPSVQTSVRPSCRFAIYILCASTPTSVYICMFWMCELALDCSWWSQQIKDDSGVHHWELIHLPLGWCVILNNWVTSVQAHSLGVMPNICAWSAPPLQRHNLAGICSLWQSAVEETSRRFISDAVSKQLHLLFNSCIPETYPHGPYPSFNSHCQTL